MRRKKQACHAQCHDEKKNMVYLTLPCVKKIEILHESVLGVSPVLQVVPQGLFTSRRSRQRAHINGRSCDTPLSSPWGGVRRGTDNRFPAHTPSATSPPCAAPSLLSRTNKERSPNPLQSNDIGRTEQGEPRAVLPTETRMTGHFGNAYLFVWQGASFFLQQEWALPSSTGAKKGKQRRQKR